MLDEDGRNRGTTVVEEDVVEEDMSRTKKD